MHLNTSVQAKIPVPGNGGKLPQCADERPEQRDQAPERKRHKHVFEQNHQLAMKLKRNGPRAEQLDASTCMYVHESAEQPAAARLLGVHVTV